MVSPWLARRYLLHARHERFLPLLTTTAIGGVAVGVFALIVVLSVMRGFQRELTERLLGFDAHVTLLPPAGEEGDEASVRAFFPTETIRELTPIVEGEVVATRDAGEEPVAQGIKVRGVLPGTLEKMERVELYFPTGGSPSPWPSPSTIILGNEVAANLLVHPDFEDEIELVAPLAEIGPTGEFVPRHRRTRVAGLFRAGVYQYDAKVAFVTLDEAKRILGEQVRFSWQVKLLREGDVTALAERLRLPAGWSFTTWREQNHKLFQALRLERIAMGTILVLIIAIASFSVMGVIMIIGTMKRRDVALLKSLGLSASRAGHVFLLVGAWIGGIGTALGGFLGVLVTLVLHRWPIPLPSSYYLDHLPVDLQGGFIVVTMGTGFLLSLMAAWIPARRAAREEICEVLRYE
ncbi:MAG: ABC transporter permease [Deltaproteobacteria bacterium]|nr:ABC transporter permease [Deltaproteobacteria bacterium]